MWLKDPEMRKEILFSASMFAVFIVLAYFTYHILSLAFIPLFWGIVLSLILYPLYRAFLQKTGWGRRWAAVLFTFAVGLVILLPLGIVSLLIGLEIGEIYHKMMRLAQPEVWRNYEAQFKASQLWMQLEAWVEFIPLNLGELLPPILKGVGNFLLKGFVAIATAIPVYIFYFIFILIVFYFGLKDGSAFIRKVREFIPLPEDSKDRVLRRFVQVIRGVFLGVIGTALFQSFMALLGYMIFGVTDALLLGLFTFFAALLGVAPIVYLFAVAFVGWTGSIWQAVFLLVWCAILVSTLDNYIRPLLIGKETGLHPLFVFIFLLGGLIRFGFTGIFLGPLILALFITFAEIIREKYFPAPEV